MKAIFYVLYFDIDKINQIVRIRGFSETRLEVGANFHVLGTSPDQRFLIQDLLNKDFVRRNAEDYARQIDSLLMAKRFCEVFIKKLRRYVQDCHNLNDNDRTSEKNLSETLVQASISTKGNAELTIKLQNWEDFDKDENLNDFYEDCVTLIATPLFESDFETIYSTMMTADSLWVEL